MTDPVVCGIYCIYFNSPLPEYYVGLSNDIYSRRKTHLSKLVNNSHPNLLLQHAYTHYGLPEIEILEICSADTLSVREIFWIKEFDSYHNGYNQTGGGEHAFGANHSLSLYTQDTYKNIVLELAYTDSSLLNISKKLNVSYEVVRDVSCGKTHTYLKTILPNEYQKMIVKSGSRKSFKYTKEDYYKVMETIAKENISLKKVSLSLGISYSVVRNIAYGSSHTYLENEYPELYKVMRTKLRTNIGGVWKVQTQ